LSFAVKRFRLFLLLDEPPDRHGLRGREVLALGVLVAFCAE
jgi:hypothetical protein